MAPWVADVLYRALLDTSPRQGRHTKLTNRRRISSDNLIKGKVMVTVRA